MYISQVCSRTKLNEHRGNEENITWELFVALLYEVATNPGNERKRHVAADLHDKLVSFLFKESTMTRFLFVMGIMMCEPFHYKNLQSMCT